MLLSLLLITLFLLVLLGFYVFVAAPRSRIHQTFAAFVSCLALWTVKDIVLWGFASEETSVAWWAGISFLISLLLQYSTLIFAWVFPEDRPLPWKHAAVIFAPGAVFVPAILAGLMWKRVGFVSGRFEIELTPLAYAFGLYIYAILGYALILLFRKYRAARSSLRGKQLGAVLWGLIITVVLNTIANVVLPLAGVYSYLKFGSILVVPGVLVYAYAISNFKLFSLQSALSQFRLFPIAYKVALSIAAVAILSFALLQIPIVWWSFGGWTISESMAEGWRRYLVFSVITALVPNLILVALVIRTISRPVRRLTEAAVTVAQGSYGAQVDLRSNDEVGLLASVFNEMSRKMAADIERLRELNEHLIRTEKLAAAGTLAAGVAHEVNNPLASISSLIQMLQARGGVDAETQEMLRLIQTQIARITQVLRDMMDFARTRPPARAPLDLNRALESALRLAGFDKAFQRLRVQVHAEKNLPHVQADADQVQQVFLNILLNARDAMPEGGDLSVRTYYSEEDEEVVTEFCDSGAGISPEILPKIFDPFFTTKPAGTGTGLGLAVCYGIITAHGGQIQIEALDGRGTCVRVSLPVSKQLIESSSREA